MGGFSLILMFWILIPLLCEALDRKPTSNPHTNYVLYCAGCHGLHGEGAVHHVPNLKESLPVLLTSPEGRQFVVSVPGVVNSELDNGHLAEVFNYLQKEWRISGSPFTASELEFGRQHPVVRVHQSRAALLGYPKSDSANTDY